MPDSQITEPGLRERKKQRTRAAIREVALKLFLTQGYDETTTAEIASAADVSVGTLFNYFATKEALVADEFDPVFIRHLRARPKDEPHLAAFRHALLDGLTEAQQSGNSDLSFARAKLTASVPALRAAAALDREHSIMLLAQLLAERAEGRQDPFEMQVLATLLVSATTVAYERWLQDDGSADVLALVERALAVVAAASTL